MSRTGRARQYGPTRPPPPTDFYASVISGAQRLPNGNTLTCDGPEGHFYEVTTSGETIWEYDYNGDPEAVFRVERYAPSYAGFDGTPLDDDPTNQAPVAEAGGPYAGNVGTTIALDGSASSDTDGTIVLYEWDLDNDGQYDDATGVTANFVAATAGTFTVGLRVTDDDGAQDTDSATVTVTGAPEATYVVVDTGQDACYDNSGEITCPSAGEAFYGQDAQYEGNAFDYTDNGNPSTGSGQAGTVTDNNTGLMWQQTPDFTKRSWNQAPAYCESLTLAGHDDWRLPAIKELYSIIDYGTGWPYLDEGYFAFEFDPVQDKNSQYWSSTHYEVGTTHGGQDTAFGVNFATGHIKGYPTGMPAYVRCVRGDIYGANDFANNGDGTVSDLATGLMWQQADDGVGRDWQDALAYAEGLDLASYDDWRLPNAKELQSIVDYTGNYPALDPAFFDTVDADGWFWTSTSAYFSPVDTGRYYAWYVAFGYATGSDGNDLHGAGAVRFATKVEGGPAAEGDEPRIYNHVRAVRDVSQSALPGDVNGDCVVNIVDIMLVAVRWGAHDGDANYDSRYDLDHDSDIDIVDIMEVAAHWGETCG